MSRGRPVWEIEIVSGPLKTYQSGFEKRKPLGVSVASARRLEKQYL
jgi:hypothetical protein